jgi:hypothetical protein
MRYSRAPTYLARGIRSAERRAGVSDAADEPRISPRAWQQACGWSIRPSSLWSSFLPVTGWCIPAVIISMGSVHGAGTVLMQLLKYLRAAAVTIQMSRMFDRWRYSSHGYARSPSQFISSDRLIFSRLFADANIKLPTSFLAKFGLDRHLPTFDYLDDTLKKNTLYVASIPISLNKWMHSVRHIMKDLVHTSGQKVYL